MKIKLLSIALALIVILKCIDLYIDYSADINKWHLVQELTLIVVASSVFIVLVFEMISRAKAVTQLKQEINASKTRNRQVSAELEIARRDFLSAITAEFLRWELTPSEQEVCLFILKGFSISEIAALRNTSEKTIRHQASAIYRKSKCHGRYELAAYFFETL